MSLFDKDLLIKEVDKKTIVRSEIISRIDKVWNEIEGSILWNDQFSKYIENSIINSFLPLRPDGYPISDYIPRLKSLGLKTTSTTVKFYDKIRPPYFVIRVRFLMKGENWDNLENAEMNIYEIIKYRDK